MEIILGATYQDVVTKTTGIATALCKYLTGCDQVQIAWSGGENEEPKSHWYDVVRLERVGDSVVKLPARSNQAPDPGGPRSTPPARKGPSRG